MINMKKIIVSLVLFLVLFSVAATAFVSTSHSYKITGLTSDGGNITDSANYKAQLAVAQPVIRDVDKNLTDEHNIGFFGEDNRKYNLCLGTFCTGAFEPRYYVNVTGKIFYDTGEAVADSEANLRVKYGRARYESGMIQTGPDGNFSAEISIPEHIATKQFKLEVYAKGRVEAVYECTVEDIAEGDYYCS